MDVTIVKMSAKGQLVVPEDIRQELHIQQGDRFIPIALREGVLFKKIILPEVKKEFEALQKRMRSHFKKHHITQKTIDEAVRWARQSSS